MIIFDLDGTLADCEHRRHFVNGSLEYCDHWHSIPNHSVDACDACKSKWKVWKPDYKSFYEACDKDTPIEPVIEIASSFFQRNISYQIWSGRCESVRNKTEKWLAYNHIEYCELKLRPIGDNTPAHELKEKWLDEYIASMWPTLPVPSKENEGQIFHRKDPIAFVFEDDPKCIEMYRRRWIFVFDCKQNMEVQ